MSIDLRGSVQSKPYIDLVWDKFKYLSIISWTSYQLLGSSAITYFSEVW